MAGKKITVLYVDGSVGFGGAPKSLALLLQGLKNVDPIIVTATRNDVREKWFHGARVYRMGRLSNYYFKVRVREWLAANLPIALLDKICLKTFAVVDLVERWVSRLQIMFLSKFHRVAIIHMNTACFPPDGLYVARWLKIPSVAHLRGFVNTKDSSFVKPMRLASIVIGCSKAVSSTVGHIKDRRCVWTVYDPVDMKLFESVSTQRDDSRRGLGLSETDIAVGIFGRVIPWKGQREFVCACIDAMRKNPHIGAFVVGDHSDSSRAYLDEIRTLISGSQLEHRFTLTGYREDVERLYVAMDIIVHASIEPEPFGMVIPEGMAAKKPVIATDAGGPSEVIESGIDGILVPPGNIEKMSAAIVDLADDPAKRRRIGEAGYRKAKARFTIDNAAARIETIYRQMLPSGS